MEGEEKLRAGMLMESGEIFEVVLKIESWNVV